MQNVELYLFIFVLGLMMGWYSTTGAKSQNVRLLDVYLYGPFLCLLALYPHWTDHFLVRMWLLFFGATTIGYNLRNYLSQEANRASSSTEAQ
jgi:hypothetical protein